MVIRNAISRQQIATLKKSQKKKVAKWHTTTSTSACECGE